MSVRNIYHTIDEEYIQTEVRYLEASHNFDDLRNFTDIVPRMKVEYSELVQAITFTSGLIHLLLGILRVEFLASYLSDQLVSAFCTGASLHVIVVQLGKLLEIPVAKFTGPGYLFRVILKCLNKIPRFSLSLILFKNCRSQTRLH